MRSKRITKRTDRIVPDASLVTIVHSDPVNLSLREFVIHRKHILSSRCRLLSPDVHPVVVLIRRVIEIGSVAASRAPCPYRCENRGSFAGFHDGSLAGSVDVTRSHHDLIDGLVVVVGTGITVLTATVDSVWRVRFVAAGDGSSSVEKTARGAFGPVHDTSRCFVRVVVRCNLRIAGL